MPKLDAFKLDNFKIDGDNINTVFTAGDVIFAASLDVVTIINKVNYTKAKDIEVNYSGVIRVSYRLTNETSSKTAWSNIFVNDAAVGTERSIVLSASSATYSQDITVSKGDHLQIYAKGVNAIVKVDLLCLKCDANPLVTVIA